MYHANSTQKKAGTAIPISDTIDLKTKIVSKDKEGHFITMKGSIHQEDISYKHIHILQKNPKIHEAKINSEWIKAMNVKNSNNILLENTEENIFITLEGRNFLSNRRKK